MDEIVREPAVRKVLIALDIDPDDHQYLSDILDPDNSGKIGIAELIDGLKRLRGGPRRSDIVSVDLMIRSLQQMVLDLAKCMTNGQGSKLNRQGLKENDQRPEGNEQRPDQSDQIPGRNVEL